MGNSDCSPGILTCEYTFSVSGSALSPSCLGARCEEQTMGHKTNSSVIVFHFGTQRCSLINFIHNAESYVYYYTEVGG